MFFLILYFYIYYNLVLRYVYIKKKYLSPSLLIFVKFKRKICYTTSFLKRFIYICSEFFMVLDFKVNRRLIVGMTINFFCPYPNTPSCKKSSDPKVARSTLGSLDYIYVRF